MPKARRKGRTNVCKTSFLNKGVKLINVSRFFRSIVKTRLPIHIKFDDPTVAYSLNSPRRSEIFSFNKFIQNLNIKAFLQDSSILPCICKDLIL